MARISRPTTLELLNAGHTLYGAARRVQRMDVIRGAGGHALEVNLFSPARLAGTLLRMHRFLPDRVFDKLVTRQR